VALLGALDLLTPGLHAPHEIASLAQRVETEKLGLQCGIQDQICSAHGGICFIEMHQYPHAMISKIEIPNSLWWELERRLVLVFLGKTHSSSDIHRQVIDGLEKKDADKSVLELLRQAAHEAKRALYSGSLDRLGKSMIANTEAQAALHPALISDDAKKAIALGTKHGAIGWKVNGAGGEGGSLTFLFGAESRQKRAFSKDLPTIDPKFQVIPTYLSRFGLRRWEEKG